MGATASRFSSEAKRNARTRRTGRNGSETRNGSAGNESETSPLLEVLGRLTQVQTAEHRVVSCYLKLEPRDRSRGKYLIKVKNRVKSALQALPRLRLDRERADEVARDLNRVQDFLRSPGNLPHTQGLAIFA